MITFFYTDDTIIFLVRKGLKQEAKTAMKKVYGLKEASDGNFNEHTFDEVIEAHYAYLCTSTSVEDSKVTLMEAICARTYRRSTWVCFGTSFFSQVSGFNVIYIAILCHLEQIYVEMGG